MFGWGGPLRNLVKALRYVELDYFCHMSSEALHCFQQHDKGTPDAKVTLDRVNTGERN